MKGEKIINEIVHNGDLILEFEDGTFVAHCFNADGDIDTYTTKDINKAKEWVDKHRIDPIDLQ